MAIPETDKSAIRQIIRGLRAAGWVLNFVYDGEDKIHVSTEAEALAAITAVDDATLVVNEGTLTGMRGWVYFVMGNDPDEVVCDYTITLESAIQKVEANWV